METSLRIVIYNMLTPIVDGMEQKHGCSGFKTGLEGKGFNLIKNSGQEGLSIGYVMSKGGDFSLHNTCQEVTVLASQVGQWHTHNNFTQPLGAIPVGIRSVSNEDP